MSVHAAPDDAKMLTALATGSRALMSAHFWSDGVDQLLGELGRASGVSRVWIFQLLELRTSSVVQDYVFEWAAAARYRQLNHKRFRFFTAAFDDPVYQQLMAERKRGKSQHLIINDLPDGPLRTNLESQGVVSMVTVPIMVDGRWWGTLGFDDCERALDWRGPGLNALTVASELISSAIYRHQLTSRRRQLELFQRVTDCGLWEIDLNRSSIWCSRALLRTLGYPDSYARVPLRRLLSRIAREDRQRLWDQVRDGLSNSRQGWRLDVRLNTSRGERLWHEIVTEVILDDGGQLHSLAGLMIDISQRKQGEQKALTAAEYDELTGVMNRRGLSRHLAESLDTGTPLAKHHWLLLDIDNFKQINDRYGHPAGDALLRLLAQRIASELRPEDGLARLGGEEFAIVVSGLADHQAQQCAERLRQAVAETAFQLSTAHDDSHHQVYVSVSLGIASLPTGDDHQYRQAQANAQADQALYAAKHAGRNRVVAYWDMP